MTEPSRRTPSQELLRYFKHDHLPEPLKKAAAIMSVAAHEMERVLPDGPEKTTGLRKLLEAKDCFVRALLPREGEAYIGKSLAERIDEADSTAGLPGEGS